LAARQAWRDAYDVVEGREEGRGGVGRRECWRWWWWWKEDEERCSCGVLWNLEASLMKMDMLGVKVVDDWRWLSRLQEALYTALMTL